MQGLGKLLLIAGLVLAVMGLLVLIAGQAGWSGRMPGDLVFRTGRTTVFFPIVTCLVLSVVLTIVLNLFFRR